MKKLVEGLEGLERHINFAEGAKFMVHKFLGVSLLVTVMICLAACRKSQESQSVGELPLPPGEEKVDGNFVLRESVVQESVEWKGKTWIYSITRKPDSTLQMVTDDDGNLCVDNKVSLNILEGDREVLAKDFTKADFNDLLTPDFLEKSILEGIVFYRTDEEGLQFATSVSYPHGSDTYVTMLINVAYDGTLTVRKDDLTDIPEEGSEDMQTP